jgi:thiol:disulfide interchange protein
MVRVAVASLVVALLACSPQPRSPASSPAPLPKVLDLVRATHRPLLVFFVAPWCKACHEFERRVLSDPRVIAALGDTFVVGNWWATGLRKRRKLPTTLVRGHGFEP